MILACCASASNEKNQAPASAPKTSGTDSLRRGSLEIPPDLSKKRCASYRTGRPAPCSHDTYMNRNDCFSIECTPHRGIYILWKQFQHAVPIYHVIRAFPLPRNRNASHPHETCSRTSEPPRHKYADAQTVSIRYRSSTSAPPHKKGLEVLPKHNRTTLDEYRIQSDEKEYPSHGDQKMFACNTFANHILTVHIAFFSIQAQACSSIEIILFVLLPSPFSPTITVF